MRIHEDPDPQQGLPVVCHWYAGNLPSFCIRFSSGLSMFCRYMKFTGDLDVVSWWFVAYR